MHGTGLFYGLLLMAFGIFLIHYSVQGEEDLGKNVLWVRLIGFGMIGVAVIFAFRAVVKA